MAQIGQMLVFWFGPGPAQPKAQKSRPGPGPMVKTWKWPKAQPRPNEAWPKVAQGQKILAQTHPYTWQWILLLCSQIKK